MLKNATESLRPGGYFIGTIPNANMIVKLLREGNGSFHNEVCDIKYMYKYEEEEFKLHQPPLFGAELNFHLEEVVNYPEYLIHFPLLVKMLEELDMELVYKYTFQEAAMFYIEKNGEEAKELFVRMDALEAIGRQNISTKNISEYEHANSLINGEDSNEKKTDVLGTLSKSEWEVASMYLVFGFRKKNVSG